MIHGETTDEWQVKLEVETYTLGESIWVTATPGYRQSPLAMELTPEAAAQLRDALTRAIDTTTPRTPTQVVCDLFHRLADALAVEQQQKEARDGHE